MFGKKQLLTVLGRKNRQKPRVRPAKLTRREIMTYIAQLEQGEILNCSLPAAYGGQMAVIEFNTMYPWKGHKYILSTQALVNGKPEGEKTFVMGSNEAEDIAAWVLHHRGVPFSAELPVSDETIGN